MMALSGFAAAFVEAGGITPGSYSGLFRFLALMCAIIATVSCINSFMGDEAKHEMDYVLKLGTRSVRIVIGITMFILLLTT